MTVPLPAATDPVEVLADWLELEALRSEEREISLESLVRIIRRGGTTDAVESERGDVGSEISQRVAQDAFSESEGRLRACGASGAYPFEVDPGLLRLRNGWESSPYIFLLLLSTTTPTGGHAGTARLFEHLCFHAARQYLGGMANKAECLLFGAPRKRPTAMLSQAIDHLCAQLAEGGGWARGPDDDHQGDEGLDLVAWRHFPDKRTGKLVAFGQCAGGQDWADKLTELDGLRFTRKWFRQSLIVDPMRFFFLPRRLPSTEWDHTGIDAGIVFDRCRLTACLGDLDEHLVQECAKIALTLIRKVFE